MSSREDELEYYQILGVDSSASQKEISTAYRLKALQFHPDKNPNLANAAALFDRLTKSYQVLTDPAAKQAYDNVLAARRERRAYEKSLDQKRKAMQDDLVEREQASRRQRNDQLRAEAKLRDELDRLRTEAKQRDLGVHGKEEADRTIKVLPLKATRQVDGPALTAVLQRFGPVESVSIGKTGQTALVRFASLSGAMAAMGAFQSSDPGLSPYLFETMGDGMETSEVRQEKSCASYGKEYESATLLRMRQAAERRRRQRQNV